MKKITRVVPLLCSFTPYLGREFQRRPQAGMDEMMPGGGCHPPQPGAALLTPSCEPAVQQGGRSGSGPPALTITELSRLEMTFKVAQSAHQPHLPRPITNPPTSLRDFHPLPWPR